jgi:hypothetical protein
MNSRLHLKCIHTEYHRVDRHTALNLDTNKSILIAIWRRLAPTSLLIFQVRNRATHSGDCGLCAVVSAVASNIQ